MASFNIPSVGGGGSPEPRSSSPDKLQPRTIVTRAKSANEVPSMAAVATMPPTNGASPIDSDFLNTLPDPRTPSPTPRLRSPASENDLSGEVSMLSTKLINAINHSTSLDDTLQQARIELEVAKKRIEELEMEARRHAKDIEAGVLVKKAEVDEQIEQMRAELDEARREREASDRAKRGMETELENLTASLFEEANNMVADARKDTEAAEKRTAQVRSQLQDTETLLASQQEQLQDLKGVMEKLSSEIDETEPLPHLSTAPSTPATDANKMSRLLDMLPLSPGIAGEFAPEHPLRFTQLLHPVLRNDLPSYNEFAELLRTSRAINSISHQRSSSGNVPARSPSNLASNPAASSSSPHLPGSFTTPLSSSITSPGPSSPALPPLKESKFYKRALTEDIEPTLRLDLAPGLSWLARRTVLTSITAGALVIEPFAPSSKLYGPVYACALCGEDRRQDIYARRHRFRTSEDVSAQRYPLCEWCVGRLRATCDFAAFLRMCRDGTWKAGTEEEIRAGWEEAVRLRERMFWGRIGGGVVPAIGKEGLGVGERERERRSREEEVRESLERAEEANEQREEEGRRVLVDEGRERPAVQLSTPPNKVGNPFEERESNTEGDAVEDTDATPVKEKRDEIAEGT
ncbi:Rab guanine nucleotide exchange factor sec2 [Sphaceloma murrayae]|uniref:Rab guanine nucleotide exchange factor sec2 n=1 Tax=Sphaceloma murrayae TaxID=2082308 RepID=A0A2K1QJZ1_9PEZI|nr:Rab guanine nucleotide exchange factor sec2 [Sphaceloma murrayae]